ncbi:porin [Cupriavidus sp. TA19]|uniref:porin n=1 Tax=Cupriavidus sp. TA19 TaxID=701108 RepID=UPI0027294AD6|nr:porin [Cupriavidus sp. TA19]GLC96670.1 porin [Cupriavidus sp. TA19]
MKKGLAIAAGCMAFANETALAQDGVTLYGVVDTNIEYVSNVSQLDSTQRGFPGPGKSRFGLTSGGLSGSRWGIRGTEDLGKGLKAIFALESGFEADTGKMAQSGRLFGRQAYVGLHQKGLGQLSFGRQYSAMFDTFSNFSPTGYTNQYEPIASMVGLDLRSDNTVKYKGEFGPVTAIANWSFGNGVASSGEVAGQFRRDSGYGFGASYLGGKVGLAMAFEQFNPTLAAGAAPARFQKAGAAATYNFENIKLTGGYRWGLNKSGSDATLARDNLYWVGANYSLAALRLTLAYYYDDLKNLNGVDVKNPWQVSFIADYNLSKRTDVYLSLAYVKNSGLNFDNTAVFYSGGNPLGADKQSMLGAAVGIRHRF